MLAFPDLGPGDTASMRCSTEPLSLCLDNGDPAALEVSRLEVAMVAGSLTVADQRRTFTGFPSKEVMLM